jgi:predicted RNA-binding Zn-ribbon protein involved in translation (DUF1610 family)
MDTAIGTLDADDRANALYWGSDRSVNQIADELDLSKGALYEMIRPLAAGLGCPTCGAEVVHPNRTAKERRRVDCAACGWHGVEDDAIPFEPRLHTSAPAEAHANDTRRVGLGFGTSDDVDNGDDMYPANDFDAPGPPPDRILARDAAIQRLMAGGALLGAAVGVALVIWARRR